MSNSSEYNLETIIVALLETNATLTQQIIHKDDDDGAQKDRIVVAVEPKMPAIKAYRETEKPKVWMSTARITIRQATRDVSAMEEYANAVDATLQASTPDAAIVTLATGLFPIGPVTISQSEEGSRQGEDVDVRIRERVYVCRWPLQSGD